LMVPTLKDGVALWFTKQIKELSSGTSLKEKTIYLIASTWLRLLKWDTPLKE